MHRGHGQLEVGLGQAGDDLPGERHVVGQRGVAVRGPQQQGEAELRGAAADVSPPEAAGLRFVGLYRTRMAVRAPARRRTAAVPTLTTPAGRKRQDWTP